MNWPLNRVSDADKEYMMRTGQCFRCYAHGHISRHCPDKGKSPPEKRITDTRIARLKEELEELINQQKITELEEDDQSEKDHRT